mgnify:CR=1 FL=1
MKPFISFCLLLCICLGKLYAQGVNIVYIGNSITPVSYTHLTLPTKLEV